jgi:hypothetical protein
MVPYTYPGAMKIKPRAISSKNLFSGLCMHVLVRNDHTAMEIAWDLLPSGTRKNISA